MPVVQRIDIDKKRKLWAEVHTKPSGRQIQIMLQTYHRHVAAHQNAAIHASNAAADAITRLYSKAYPKDDERLAHATDEAKAIAAAAAVGAATAEAERDELGAYYDMLLLLTESWNLEDPDKPGEIVPKSNEGIDRAAGSDILALRDALLPTINVAFGGKAEDSPN